MLTVTWAMATVPCFLAAENFFEAPDRTIQASLDLFVHGLQVGIFLAQGIAVAPVIARAAAHGAASLDHFFQARKRAVQALERTIHS